MKKYIIDIVGLAGSGKSSLCDFISQEYGFELYRPSDVIREYAQRTGRKLEGRRDYVNCHQELINDDPLAMIKPVIENPAQRICLDGLRAPLPFLLLKEDYDAKLIYLDCPADVRLARIQSDYSRSGHRKVLSLEALLADEAPDHLNPNRHLPNMDEMRLLADYTIDATVSQDEIIRRTKDILDELLAT